MKDIKNFILESNEHLEEITADMRSWWDKNYKSDNYDKDDIIAMYHKKNDMIVDDVFNYLEKTCKWSRSDLNKYEYNLIEALAQWAKEAVKEL